MNAIEKSILNKINKLLESNKTKINNIYDLVVAWHPNVFTTSVLGYYATMAVGLLNNNRNKCQLLTKIELEYLIQKTPPNRSDEFYRSTFDIIVKSNSHLDVSKELIYDILKKTDLNILNYNMEAVITECFICNTTHNLNFSPNLFGYIIKNTSEKSFNSYDKVLSLPLLHALFFRKDQKLNINLDSWFEMYKKTTPENIQKIKDVLDRDGFYEGLSFLISIEEYGVLQKDYANISKSVPGSPKKSL